MAEIENLRIEQGRSGSVVVTITGVTDWTGIVAKLFAAASYGSSPVMTLTGSINDQTDVVTFDYSHSDTKELSLKRYYYEVVLYKADKSEVKTSTIGILTVDPVIVVDPTV